MSIKQLIAISNQVISDDQEEPTVNARELHAFLESKQEFANWIKKRIADYGFVEGTDYVRFELSADLKMAESGGDLSEILALQKNQALETTGCRSFGQQGRIEYAITLDMAKELSMVEKTAKGKQARQYFIACEKQARSNKDCKNCLHQNQALKQELLKANPKWRKILYCYRLGLSQRNTAKILGVTQECVWRHLARMKTCGLIKATRATPLHLPLLTD
jgi:anti-repressor protein